MATPRAPPKKLGAMVARTKKAAANAPAMLAIAKSRPSLSRESL